MFRARFRYYLELDCPRHTKKPHPHLCQSSERHVLWQEHEHLPEVSPFSHGRRLEVSSALGQSNLFEAEIEEGCQIVLRWAR